MATQHSRWLGTLLLARACSASNVCDAIECFSAYRSQLQYQNASLGGTVSVVGRDGRVSETAGSYWWDNAALPGGLKIQKMDDRLYPRVYFEAIQGQTSPYYLSSAIELTSRILGKKAQSVLELGNGGGYYAEMLFKRKFDVITVEGARAAVESTVLRGVPRERIVRHDLRLPLVLSRRFDIALLTEVVEHVEPPFSSQVVLNAILHSDVIWFSFGDVTSGKARPDHPNERPGALWTNLFDFYGFDCVAIPENVRKVAKRGNFIAFNRSNPSLRRLSTQDLAVANPKKDLKQWKFAWLKADGTRLAPGTRLKKAGLKALP